MDTPFSDGDIVTIEPLPAYDLEPWKKRVSSVGPQCSGSKEFCFFCSFSEPDDEGSDGAALWDVVRQMAAKKKELPKIVTTVSSIYEKHIQSSITYVIDGKAVDGPEWTKESISRHLMFSSEFPQLFDTTIEHIYRSLIVAQNNVVIDGATGRVIPEARKELVETIDAYARFRSKGTRPKRKRKAIEQ